MGVEADPGNEDFVVSHAISRTFLGHALAASGKFDQAESVLRAVMPELERLARADTSDTRFPADLIEANLSMGLVEMGRAKQATGSAATASAHWRRSRDWLLDAQGGYERLLARQGIWTHSREESEAIAAALAECRKALGE